MQLHQPIQERAVLVGFQAKAGRGVRATADPLEELQNLARSAGALAAGQIVHTLRAIDPAFFVTHGKAEALRDLAAEKQADLVIFDAELTAAQQRNLEDFLGIKVLDRTGLILDIFAQRARSREGKLQIELAQLNYLMPRLKGSAQELSRLGGGIGTRGPGEKKLEVDRRKIRERVIRIKHDLEKVRNTRSVQRHGRRTRFAYPAVFVGYTNAGKSSLLNRLTAAEVMAENRLFSTLDPTTRIMKLADGNEILLSDTVGFIHNLPHQLIAAFKATLEEVQEAQLLLHVIDVSNPCAEEHVASVNAVLEELGIHERETIYILNKIDALADRSLITFWTRRLSPVVAVSARTGEGLGSLAGQIDRWISVRTPKVCFRLPLSEQSVIDRILKSSKVLYKQCQGSELLITARIDYRLAHNLRRFAVPSFDSHA